MCVGGVRFGSVRFGSRPTPFDLAHVYMYTTVF